VTIAARSLYPDLGVTSPAHPAAIDKNEVVFDALKRPKWRIELHSKRLDICVAYTIGQLRD
jgi:hypothetical protein